jgi:hypothetical protein
MSRAISARSYLIIPMQNVVELGSALESTTFAPESSFTGDAALP